MLFDGIPILVTKHLPDVVSSRPARPHHRPRIQKKWIKRFGVKEKRKPVCFQEGRGMGMRLICNDLYMDELRRLSASPANKAIGDLG